MWIADVAAIVARPGMLNWQTVSESARAAGAGRIVRLGLRLAAKLLRAPLPRDIEQAITKDSESLRMARKVEKWLPAAGDPTPGILERSEFRVVMSGGGFSGARYLLRLAFSPTEEDWSANEASRSTRFREAAGRPFRLARKYGREGH